MNKDGKVLGNSGKRICNHGLQYLNGAFLTSQTTIVKYLVNKNLYACLTNDMLLELKKLVSYAKEANQKCVGGWTYARIGILDSELTPIPSTEIPMISNLAHMLARSESNTISQVKTANLTSSQSQIVNKSLELCKTVLEISDMEKLTVSHVVAGGDSCIFDIIEKDVKGYGTECDSQQIENTESIPASADIRVHTDYRNLPSALAQGEANSFES